MMDARVLFYKELENIYKFKEVRNPEMPYWDKCFVYHEEGTTFFVELLVVGSTYILREQRGEVVVFNFYHITDQVLERLDYIM